MNPSDFGADIFDPNDDQQTPKAAAPDQEPATPDGEAQPTESKAAEEGDEEPKPARKKARKKAPSRRKKADADETAEEPIAEPAEASDEAEVEAAPTAEASEPSTVESEPETAEEPVEAERREDREEGGERRSRRRRRRRGGARDEAAEAAPTDDGSDETEAEAIADHGDGRDSDDVGDDSSAGDDDRGDADDERGGRRRRRRRRRGGRGEEPTAEAAEEVEDEVRAGMEPRQPLRRSDRMIPVPTPGSERSGQRVAVLVDLAALLEQARTQGGELAFGKLVQHLARRRHLIRAIAYASPELLVEIGSALRGSDLDVHAIATPSDLPVALAVDAMSLASRVDCVVLAPAVDHLAPLAAALRAHGVRIETASFTETGGMADDLATARHPLGAESLFVP